MKTQTTLQWKNIPIFKKFMVWIFVLFGLNSSAQNVQSILNENWINGNWQNSVQSFYTYDGSNYLTNTLSQSWIMPSGPWENALQLKYTNNPDGTVNLTLAQTWDSGTSTWNDAQRVTYTYNPGKKMLTGISELWIGAWQNFLKQTNTYDGSNYLTHTLFQTWDFIPSTWKNSTQTTYTNNPNGTVNQSVTQAWDITNVWVNSERTSYTYNASNNVVTAVSEMWTGTTWLNDNRQTNTYGAGGFIINQLSQIWNTTSSIWVNQSQSLYTNNATGKPTQIIIQSWDTGASIWNNSQRITFNYTLGISEWIKKNGIVLYPNPADDVINLKTNELLYGSAYSINDQNGRQILTGTLNSETTEMDISPLSPGVYYLKIGSAHQHAVKMIKK